MSDAERNHNFYTCTLEDCHLCDEIGAEIADNYCSFLDSPHDEYDGLLDDDSPVFGNDLGRA